MHRLYRALLRLYPVEFRDEYGREMAQMVRDRIAREPRARLWIDLLRDLLRTAPKEHAHVLLNDVRYAVRLIRRAPMFASAVVGTVALAIAANTAIFSVVNAVLLRPLPYPESERLVWLSERGPNFPTMSISYPNFTDWRAQQTVFEHLGVYNWGSYNLTGRGEPQRLTGVRLSADALSA